VSRVTDGLDGTAPGGDDWRLVIETATHRTVVAVGRGRIVVATSVVDAPDRHGTRLMSQLDQVLAEAAISTADIQVIGVGTGPGSFTGLRVGLATAKTLAALRHLPLVGIPTDESLRRAAATSLGSPASTHATVILPAGARDHYLAVAGADPVLLPPGTDLGHVLGAVPVAVVDMAADGDWLAPARDAALAAGWPTPEVLGRAACDGLPAALLALLDERLAMGAQADAATLVPRYVALPRGIPAATAGAADALDASHGGEGTWSPGFR